MNWLVIYTSSSQNFTSHWYASSDVVGSETAGGVDENLYMVSRSRDCLSSTSSWVYLLKLFRRVTTNPTNYPHYVFSSSQKYLLLRLRLYFKR